MEAWKARKLEAINPQEDSVTFYHLCRFCEKGVERIGVKKEVDNGLIYTKDPNFEINN